MVKHPFDPVALVFGLVFAAAGVIVITGGRLIDEGRVLVPLGLVALGVGLLFRPARPMPTPPASTAPLGYADTTDPDPEPGPGPGPGPGGLAPTDASGGSVGPTDQDEPASPGPSDGDTGGTEVGTRADEGVSEHGPSRTVESDAPGGTGDAEPAGDERPTGPGAEFYLGPGWRAPDDDAEGETPGK